MSHSIKEIKKMIPMYLNGRLSEEESREFENALETHPELADELNDFSEINAYYEGLENDLPDPSNDLFARVMNNIETEKKSISRSQKIGIIEKIIGLFKMTFATPRIAWACAAVQFAVIIFIVATGPIETDFETQSPKDPLITKDMVLVNVIFNEDAKEREIRELLGKTETNIINGPSANGLYVLEIKDSGKSSDFLKVIQNSNIVKFAEIRM